MATIFDLEEKDPLDLIVKNKNFVKYLRGNGIDGFEINKIMRNSHGLKSEIPLPLTKQAAAGIRQVDYAMRYLKILIKNPQITDDEADFFNKTYNRLFRAQRGIEKNKLGKPVLKWQFGEGEGNAKTFKQMQGLRVVALHKYISTFNKPRARHQKAFLQKDIFNLIAELFDVLQQYKLTAQQIKNFDKNNW